MKLCQHFPHLKLSTIKTIYSHLDEDFEVTREYLKEKNAKQYVANPHDMDKIQRKQDQKKNSPTKITKQTYQNQNFKLPSYMSSNSAIDEILHTQSYESIRDRVN